MLIESVEWDDANLNHATGHGVSADEIDQAIGNAKRVARNKKGRSATHLLHGITDGGRKVVVVVAYNSTRRTVRPVTAGEE